MNSPADVLARILQMLEADLAKTTIDTWFEDATAVELTDKKLVLYTPTRFKRDVIENRYAGFVNEALKALFSSDVTLEIRSGDPPAEEPVGEEEEGSFGFADFTFDQYVVGPSNNFAHAAAEAVSKAPAKKYNPLVIYGESGLGKTHLMCAIANRIRHDHPEMRIVYRKGEQFMNEVIEAVRAPDNREPVANLHNTYRQADLLLIDDIQAIANKPSTEDEFFHTFNALYEAHKQIVVTCDRPPKEIRTLADRIKSRLEAGLLADIQPPDFETRMAILRNKAARIGLEVDDKFLQYIATNITVNIRQLEGTVKKLAAIQSLMGETINQATVTRIVKEVMRETPGMKPTPNLIIDEVAAFYGLEPDALQGPSRRKDTLIPRQVAMYIMREMTDLSLPEIGRQFGRDHSTAIHSIGKIEELIHAGRVQKDEVRDIMNNITSR